jgi:hypothetical protein
MFSSQPLPASTHPLHPQHLTHPFEPQSRSSTYDTDPYSMPEYDGPNLTPDTPLRPYAEPSRAYSSGAQGYGYGHVGSSQQLPPITRPDYGWSQVSPITPFNPAIQTPTLPTQYAPSIPSQSTPPVHYGNYSYPITPVGPSLPHSSSSHSLPFIPGARYPPQQWTSLSTPNTSQTSPTDSSPRALSEIGPPLASTLSSSGKVTAAHPNPGSMHYHTVPDGPALISSTHEDSIAGLTERLGEFLFNPKESGSRKMHTSGGLQPPQPLRDVARPLIEPDGLRDDEREIL